MSTGGIIGMDRAVGRRFPHLRKPQVKVLGEYSPGMVLAGRCGLNCVAFVLGGCSVFGEPGESDAYGGNANGRGAAVSADSS